MGQDLRTAVGRAAQLPTPPQLALQILELVGRADLQPRELCEVLRRDRVLSLRLLKLAGARRAGRTLTSLEDALDEVGLPAAKILALGFTLAQPETLPFDLLDTSRCAHASAVAARELARWSGELDPSLAYSAGLLEDTGAVALRLAFPERCQWVDARFHAHEGPRRQLEREQFGFDHHEVTLGVLDENGIGAPLRKALEAPLPERESEASSDPWVRLRSAAMAIRDRLSPPDASHDLAAPAFSAFVQDPEERRRLFREIGRLQQRDSRLFSSDGVNADTLREMRSAAPHLLLSISLGASADLDRIQQRASQARERASLLERNHLQLVQLATRDGLTGLANRFELDRRLSRHFEEARDHHGFGLLMVDLDHFKRVNDSHGHAAGDEVLRRVGAVLAEQVDENEVAGRYGGEEFCLVVREGHAPALARRGEQVRTAVEQIRIELADGSEIRPTASIGAAGFSADEIDEGLEELRERADRALYRSKESGRNRVTVSESAPAL